MHVTARGYLTSGVAVLGAGAIALSPIQPVPDHMAVAPQRAVESLAVNLAATIDPITPWVDTFKTAGANIKTLVEFYLQKPFPLLQTIGANAKTYIEEIANGQADLIPGQIRTNIQTFFQAPWSPGKQTNFGPFLPDGPDPLDIAFDSDNGGGQYLSQTRPNVGNSPNALYGGIIQLLVGDALSPDCQDSGKCLLATPGLAPILNFLNTNYSGQLVGLVGTVISPLVQLTRSFTAIGDYFKNGEVLAAINELINIPAKTTNAFLNGGGYLDLTAVLNQIAPLPVDSIGLNLGGLLNAVPANGNLQDPDDPPTEWAGGGAFDGVFVGFSPPPAELFASGLPVGWAGSVIGLGQFLAKEMLVTPPVKATAAVAPAAAATAPVAEAAPAVAETPSAAIADAPAVVEAPAAPAAAPAAPAEPVAEALEALEEAPAVVADAPTRAKTAAPGRGASRASAGGGDNGVSDNGSRGGARGQRGAA